MKKEFLLLGVFCVVSMVRGMESKVHQLRSLKVEVTQLTLAEKSTLMLKYHGQATLLIQYLKTREQELAEVPPEIFGGPWVDVRENQEDGQSKVTIEFKHPCGIYSLTMPEGTTFNLPD